MKKEYLFNCFDLLSGKQDIIYYGTGETEKEAEQNAKIPPEHEVNFSFIIEEAK